MYLLVVFFFLVFQMRVVREDYLGQLQNHVSILSYQRGFAMVRNTSLCSAMRHNFFAEKHTPEQSLVCSV